MHIIHKIKKYRRVELRTSSFCYVGEKTKLQTFDTGEGHSFTENLTPRLRKWSEINSAIYRARNLTVKI